MRLKTLSLAIGALLLSAGVASAAVVTRDLNLRSGPGTRYAVIDTMPAGAHVDVLGCAGTWCRVDWRGRVGFASRHYLAGEGAYVYRDYYYYPGVSVWPFGYTWGWGPRWGGRYYYGGRPHYRYYGGRHRYYGGRPHYRGGARGIHPRSGVRSGPPRGGFRGGPAGGSGRVFGGGGGGGPNQPGGGSPGGRHHRR